MLSSGNNLHYIATQLNPYVSGTLTATLVENAQAWNSGGRLYRVFGRMGETVADLFGGDSFPSDMPVPNNLISPPGIHASGGRSYLIFCGPAQVPPCSGGPISSSR